LLASEQFSGLTTVGVEVAIILDSPALVNPLSSGQNRQHSEIVFFDFSSVFHMIQPALLCNNLKKMKMDASSTAWIIDYLTNKPQFKIKIRFIIMPTCIHMKFVLRF